LFAVGHLALGYLLGKGSSRLLKTGLNLPIVFVLSVIPDVDLIIPGLMHRGPTHSLILALAVFIPFLVIYRRKAVPYMLALVSHPLIGDYVAGGRVQLLWPLATQYGLGIDIKSQTNMALEWAIFLASMIIMLRTRDIAKLFQPHDSNLILTIPMFTALLPTLLSFPLGVPPWLIPPHVAYVLICAASITIDLSKKVKDSTHGFLNRPSQNQHKQKTQIHRYNQPALLC
jgi:membrane-bound metal-dependent hydrolase YbcI (DUF457 family)